MSKNLLVTATILFAHSFAHATPPPPQGDSKPGGATAMVVQQWIDAAEARFALLDVAALTKAKDRVLAQLNELESQLATEPLGQELSRHCQLGALRSALDRQSPQWDDLEASYRRLRRRQPGEDQTRITHLRIAIASYASLIRLHSDPKAQESFTRHVRRLGRALASPTNTPTPNAEAALRRSYTYLARSALVTDLLAETRRQISHPNQMLTVRESFLAAVAPSDGSAPITFDESIEGTQVRGAGEVNYDILLDIVPNQQRAQLAVRVTGSADIPLTARKKPVTIGALGRLQFSAQEPVFFDGRNVATGNPAISTAYHSQMRSLCLDPRPSVLHMLRPLVCRAASKRLAESDRKASQKVKSNIEQTLEDESAVILSQINELISFVFWRTFEPSDVDPQLLIHSTDTSLELSAEYVGPYDIGVLTKPLPKGEIQHPISAILHESAINNAAVVLSGRWIDEQIVHELVYDSLQLVPQFANPLPEPRRAAKFQLAETSPLRARFSESKIRVTLRITAFEFNGRLHDGPTHTATIVYEPEISTGQMALLREGEIRIEPRDAPDIPQLRKTLERFFPLAAREAESESTAARLLDIEDLSVQDGWVSLSLRQAAGDSPQNHPGELPQRASDD